MVVNSSTSVEAGEALAAELPGASYVRADVADEDQAQRMVDEVVDRHGRLDVLVNNAGTTEVIPHADLEAASAEVWRRIFEVNVVGHLAGHRGRRRAPPGVRTRTGGQRLLAGRRATRRQLDPLRLLEGGASAT